MYLILDLPTILYKNLLCEWIVPKDLVMFDSSVCNHFFRKYLETVYESEWFVLEIDESVDIKQIVTDSVCVLNLRKLNWLSFHNIKFKSLYVLVLGSFSFLDHLSSYLNACSTHIQHIFIRCEVGYNLWRDVYEDEDRVRHDLMLELEQNKSYVAPEIIPDGYINDANLSLLLARCPNVKGLTVHNLLSLNRNIWVTFLQKLTYFAWSESFQPYMTNEELKQHLKYKDPYEIYCEQQYQEYLASCDEFEKEEMLSLERNKYDICFCGNVFLSSLLCIHQSECMTYLEHSYDLERKKKGTVLWYIDPLHSQFKENFSEIIVEVCPLLVEVESGVYKLV